MIATRKPGLLCLAGLALSLSASALASPGSDAPAAVSAATPAIGTPASATPDIAPLAPVWIFPSEGSLAPVASSPTVYRDTVYVGTDDGKLFALRATGPDGGKVLPGFPLQLDGAVKGRPAVYGARDGERVYVATTNGSLYAFRLDGTPAWPRNPQAVSPGAPILSTPAVRGDYVYVTTSDGRILRRHVSDGRAAGGFTYGRTVQTRLPREQRVTGTRTHIEVEDASGLFPAGRIRVISNNPLGETVVTTYTYSGVNTAMRPNRLMNLSPVGDGDPLALNPKDSVILGEGPGVSCNVSPAVPGRDEATFVITALDGTAAASRYTPADPNLVALKSEPYGLLPQ
jgi:hypothetical protein